MKYVYLSLVTVLASNICVDSAQASRAAAGGPTAADGIFLGFTMPGASDLRDVLGAPIAAQAAAQEVGKRKRGDFSLNRNAARLEGNGAAAEPVEAQRSSGPTFGMEGLRGSLSRIASGGSPHGDMDSCHSDSDNEMHRLSTVPNRRSAPVISFVSLSCDKVPGATSAFSEPSLLVAPKAVVASAAPAGK